MSATDIRWIQRLNNFNKAFEQLAEAVALAAQRELSKLEAQGLIQTFEYTHELAWNTLKDFLESRGAQKMYGSKDASREAVKAGLLENGETWMAMINSRNRTAHTYDEATAEEIVAAVKNFYFAEFEALSAKLRRLQEEEEST
ncbi:MAG: nucleotidyltransferase substrate binding protein [candidate division KSB1 bacterium]